MEPRIQYAQTEDGVSIAYWTMGEGPPLVMMADTLWSHIQLEWHRPPQRRWYERLGEKRKLVRFDHRGSGLSERNVADFSLDAQVGDLEAVVDCLGLEMFSLVGAVHCGPVAISYASRHPGRVSRLVLLGSWARHADLYDSPSMKAGRALREALLQDHWEEFTETYAHWATGWSKGESSHEIAAFMRECTTPENAKASIAAAREVDVTPLLAKVSTPTLVVHRAQSHTTVEIARGLTARIPDARLVVLGGRTAQYSDDMEAAASAIDEFVGEGEEAATPGLASDDVHTILFTDVEGSTALTQRLGDAKARELLREHERMVREALKAHGGSEVKTLGDGFMASFSSATKALECAIAMQRAFAQHNEAAAETILVRVGLNAGEPIAEDDDLFGTAVNEAARITATAKGGEILVSNVVRELTKGKDFLFADRGETSLKGFDEPVRLYEVRWEEDG